MTNQIFTFFAWVFGNLTMLLGGVLFLDLILSSVAFLFVGDFWSIIQICLESHLGSGGGAFDASNWKLDSGLKGLDLIVNWFLSLQYQVTGRWKMFAISLFVSLIILIVGLLVFDLDLVINSSNPKTPKDISIVCLIGSLTVLIMIAPLLFGGIFGFYKIIFEWITST